MSMLFGRAWKIQILAPANQANTNTLLQISSSDTETKALRVTFDVEQYPRSMFQAELKIYNPNLQTIQTIPEGSIVSIAAGYQAEGTPTEIFRGPVFQATWGKEEPYTTVLTLHCYLGLQQLMESMVSVTVGPLATQRDIVLKMAENCSLPVAYIAPASDFKAGSLPRSSTIFGTPQKIFGQIAGNNNMASSFGAEGFAMGEFKGKDVSDIIYSPPLQGGQTEESGISYRIIGTPQQTQEGVSFKVLLDPRLLFKIPPLQVQLKNSVINQSAFIFDPEKGAQIPTILNQDGVYLVAGVRHVGDTRGNIWESQVFGMVVAGSIVAVAGGGVH
jgi:hypothetical protein